MFILGKLVAKNSQIIKGFFWKKFNNKSPCITKSLLGCFFIDGPTKN
jgi:hypothetical protein